MKRLALLVLLLAAQSLTPGVAVSRLPPDTPLRVMQGRVFVLLDGLLANTNDAAITRIFLCRLDKGRCSETVWDIEFPSGWKNAKIELFGTYPDSTVHTVNPSALQAGGSYFMQIDFQEKGWRHKQTVSNLVSNFCLSEEAGKLGVEDKATCLSRINQERQQATP